MARTAPLIPNSSGGAVPLSPIADLDALFRNASRNGSHHPSYRRHHAMRSVGQFSQLSLGGISTDHTSVPSISKSG
jgi:hypothetical protein